MLISFREISFYLCPSEMMFRLTLNFVYDKIFCYPWFVSMMELLICPSEIRYNIKAVKKSNTWAKHGSVYDFPNSFILHLCLRLKVVDPCLIHGDKSMQTLSFIMVNHNQTINWNFFVLLFFYFEQTRHSYLRSQKPFEISMTSTSSQTFNQLSSCTVMRIFYHVCGGLNPAFQYCVEVNEGAEFSK